jgi:hydrogenase maturation protease
LALSAPAPYLVLGLGNELFSDEGLGVVAARSFEDRDLANVEVVDGGTLGIELVATIEGRQGLLLLDAVAVDGGAPGDILIFEGDELRLSRQLLFSAHQIGVAEALAAADLLGRGPQQIAAVGMVPFSLETGYGVTAGAKARLPEMISTAETILTRWGVAAQANGLDRTDV